MTSVGACMKTPASVHHLKIAGILVLSVLTAATLGYMLIAGLSFFDALYLAIDMMATIGSTSVSLTEAGRIFTIFVIIFGVGSLLYTLSAGMEFMIEGHFSQTVRRYLMDNRIAALRGHSIICGFGRVGSQIAEDCAATGKAFVVIDEKEQNIQTCIQRGYLALQGDATSDEVLREAGILRAGSVLVATDNDAHNISITLSARHLNEKLLIVARANRRETEAKLKRAGADRVLSLYAIGGHRMANLAFQPGIVEFFDSLTGVSNLELAGREVTLDRTSLLIGKTIAQADMIVNNEVVIVGLKKLDGALIGPRREALIEEGDTVIVVGVPGQLARFAAKNSRQQP